MFTSFLIMVVTEYQISQISVVFNFHPYQIGMGEAVGANLHTITSGPLCDCCIQLLPNTTDILAV